MKKHFLLNIILSIGLLSSCQAAAKNHKPMRSIIYHDVLLEEAKEAIHNNDEHIIPIYKAIKRYVDTVSLNMKPLSVVSENKKHIAPSKDPRDYITLSPYWWADPSKADGIPYIRDDGKRNPEVYEYPERVNSSLFAENAELLALMYYFTGEEKYAAKAAEMLRVWFLDPVSGMNPNMTYAQHVPGMQHIRGTGIIDSRRFLKALNAAKIIESSSSWTSEDKKELQDWAHAFRYWIEHSTNGLTELKAQNNHGLWYEVINQILVMFEEDYDYFKQIVDERFLPRIALQIDSDGSFPKELERTLGIHYSTFALEALSFSDKMCSKNGLNLWEYQSENGRGMILALEYMIPYYKNPDAWPHKQINDFNTDRAAILLYDAGLRTGEKKYLDLAKSIGYDNQRIIEEGYLDVLPDINRLLYYKINVRD
ncbi:MAG TPA: alginate lyase family protein [Dysgonamonadaceae bacterium]|nr:alginate lyase family protein [Dysgonamonadaceae bacterium]